MPDTIPAPTITRLSGGLHVLRTSLELPLTPVAVFPFFADAGNLERITPPELHFHVLTPGPIHLRTGARIAYRLRLFGVPFRWHTIISRWQPPALFVDEQIQGPYRQWVHTHRFTPIPGGTRIDDTVHYRLPLFPLGEVAAPLIRVQLQRIFTYRQATLRTLLAPSP